METKKIESVHGKYIDVLSDWGFKRMFGEEDRKQFLIDFLNSILPGSHIQDLSYLPTEQQGLTNSDRNAIFDITCKDKDGSYFIVEVQKLNKHDFVDRAVFYSSFYLQRLEKGLKQYKLYPVHFISVLNYVEFGYDNRVVRHAQIMDTEDHKLISNAISLTFIELPKFRKELAELENESDEWCFVLKNMKSFSSMPDKMSPRFSSFFHAAEYLNLSHEERTKYDKEMDRERDRIAENQWAFDSGLEQGREEGALQYQLTMLKNMLAQQMDDESIQKILGIDKEKLGDLKKIL